MGINFEVDKLINGRNASSKFDQMVFSVIKNEKIWIILIESIILIIATACGFKKYKQLRNEMMGLEIDE